MWSGPMHPLDYTHHGFLSEHATEFHALFTQVCKHAGMRHLSHAAMPPFRKRAVKFYLRFHEFRVALVDLHLFELIVPVVRV